MHQPIQPAAQGSRLYRAYNWIYTQLSLRAISKSIIVLAIFGFFPGSWLIGLPLLATYGLIHTFLIRRDPVRFSALYAPYIHNIRRLINNINQFTAENLAQLIVNNPLFVAKLIASFFIVFTWTMPFSLFTIYGMFRLTNEDYQEVFNRRANTLYDWTLGLVVGGSRRSSFEMKLGLFSAACILIAALSYAVGGLAVVASIAETLLEMCATTVGLTAIGRDIRLFAQNPIRLVTEHSGKFWGIVWGRWLAFALFPGRIVGHMGPAVGQIDGAGIMPSLFKTLFPATPWFTFGSGLGSLITSRFVSFLNSIVTSVVFSHNMRLQGDFYGVLGPTSFQIFAAMAIGGLIGYGFESFATRLYNTAAVDAQLVTNAARPRVNAVGNFFYRNRWSMGFVAGITPVVLASPGGAIFYTLGLGNTALATGLTALTGVTALTAIYATAHGVRVVAGRLFRRQEVAAPIIEIANIPANANIPAATDAGLVALQMPTVAFVPAYEGAPAEPLAPPAIPVMLEEEPAPPSPSNLPAPI